MSKFLDENILKRVAERNGFDPESLLQVIKRFDGLRTDLKEQAVARAIQTENWGQLDAFICFGFWSLTPALQPLPEPVAKIPDVAEAWELESLKQSKRAVSLGKEFVTNRSWNDLKHMLQRVPPELQKHPVIYSEWRSAALGRLWAVMPHGWTEFIALDPRLQKDPVVLQKRKMHWLAYFKAGSTKCYVSPKEESVQDLELYYLPGGVDAATGAPDAESLANLEVYSAWRNAWLRVYRAYTGQPPVPPPRELRENSKLHQLWREAWVTYYKTYRPTRKRFGLSTPVAPPDELHRDEAVLEALRKATN